MDYCIACLIIEQLHTYDDNIWSLGYEVGKIVKHGNSQNVQFSSIRFDH